jgi:hypothetical protein
MTSQSQPQSKGVCYYVFVLFWDDTLWDFISKSNLLNYVHIQIGSNQTN